MHGKGEALRHYGVHGDALRPYGGPLPPREGVDLLYALKGLFTPQISCTSPFTPTDEVWGESYALKAGGRCSTPFIMSFNVLGEVCLIWEDSRAHEVSHVDWKTQVGALFMSGLGHSPKHYK